MASAFRRLLGGKAHEPYGATALCIGHFRDITGCEPAGPSGGLVAFEDIRTSSFKGLFKLGQKDAGGLHSQARLSLQKFLKSLGFQDLSFLEGPAGLTKEKVLSKLQKLFKACTTPVVLVYYCGSADERGNWSVASQSAKSTDLTVHSVVSFREVSSLWLKHRKHSQRLVIVMDCPASGAWVHALRSLSKAEQLELSLAVQASDCWLGNPEEANLQAPTPGLFTSAFIQCNTADKGVSAALSVRQLAAWPEGVNPSYYATWLTDSLLDYGIPLHFCQSGGSPALLLDVLPGFSSHDMHAGARGPAARRRSTTEVSDHKHLNAQLLHGAPAAVARPTSVQGVMPYTFAGVKDQSQQQEATTSAYLAPVSHSNDHGQSLKNPSAPQHVGNIISTCSAPGGCHKSPGPPQFMSEPPHSAFSATRDAVVVVGAAAGGDGSGADATRLVPSGCDEAGRVAAGSCSGPTALSVVVGQQGGDEQDGLRDALLQCESSMADSQTPGSTRPPSTLHHRFDTQTSVALSAHSETRAEAWESTRRAAVLAASTLRDHHVSTSFSIVQTKGSSVMSVTSALSQRPSDSRHQDTAAPAAVHEGPRPPRDAFLSPDTDMALFDAQLMNRLTDLRDNRRRQNRRSVVMGEEEVAHMLDEDANDNYQPSAMASIASLPPGMLPLPGHGRAEGHFTGDSTALNGASGIGMDTTSATQLDAALDSFMLTDAGGQMPLPVLPQPADEAQDYVMHYAHQGPSSDQQQQEHQESALAQPKPSGSVQATPASSSRSPSGGPAAIGGTAAAAARLDGSACQRQSSFRESPLASGGSRLFMTSYAGDLRASVELPPGLPTTPRASMAVAPRTSLNMGASAATGAAAANGAHGGSMNNGGVGSPLETASMSSRPSITRHRVASMSGALRLAALARQYSVADSVAESDADSICPTPVGTRKPVRFEMAGSETSSFLFNDEHDREALLAHLANYGRQLEEHIAAVVDPQAAAAAGGRGSNEGDGDGHAPDYREYVDPSYMDYREADAPGVMDCDDGPQVPWQQSHHHHHHHSHGIDGHDQQRQQEYGQQHPQVYAGASAVPMGVAAMSGALPVSIGDGGTHSVMHDVLGAGGHAAMQDVTDGDASGRVVAHISMS